MTSKLSVQFSGFKKKKVGMAIVGCQSRIMKAQGYGSRGGTMGTTRNPRPAWHRTHGGEHLGGTRKAGLGQGSKEPVEAHTWLSALPRSVFPDSQLSVKDGLEWGDDEGLAKSSTYSARRAGVRDLRDPGEGI